MARSEIPQIQQQPTGIAGFDTLLRGGLVEGGLYLVTGDPGTGKTTLGNHLAFNAVKEGHNALYVTVMAESHGRMIKHLAEFGFLDQTLIGEQIHYLSVYDALMEGGLDGVQAMLRRAIRERGYRLMVIDGAAILGLAAGSQLEFSKFIADLSVQMSALDCTLILLSVQPGHPEDQAIAPYVDGIFVLEDHSVGLRNIRYLNMIKVRGVGHVRGRHRFTISNRGVEVFPRLESVLEASALDLGQNTRRVPSGVPAIDDIVEGGFLAGTATLVWGPPGIGKTILGLHFITEGAEQGERGLIATFHESVGTLTTVAAGIGQKLGSMQQQGLIQVFSTLDPELPADDWAWTLLSQIEQHQPTRVLIDGLSNVAHLGLESSRLVAFSRALSSQLSSRGISVMYTAESPVLSGFGVGMPQYELAEMSDNVVLLHYVQAVERMHRFMTVFKARSTAHDLAAREFTITDHGITLNEDQDASAQILSAAASRHSPETAS